jgi:hypothetical protein
MACLTASVDPTAPTVGGRDENTKQFLGWSIYAEEKGELHL